MKGQTPEESNSEFITAIDVLGADPNLDHPCKEMIILTRRILRLMASIDSADPFDFEIQQFTYVRNRFILFKDPIWLAILERLETIDRAYLRLCPVCKILFYRAKARDGTCSSPCKEMQRDLKKKWCDYAKAD